MKNPIALKSLSLFKKLVLTLFLIPLLVLLGLAVLETYLSVQSYRQWKSWKRDVQIAERDDMLNSIDNLFHLGKDEKAWEARLKIHPFFGFVYNATAGEINNYGFQTKYDFRPCEKGLCIVRADGDVGKPYVIGIFGGSMAHMVGEMADQLEKRLTPLLIGKSIKVVNFGVGGQSSAASLNVFSYFREALDAALFIDGASEIWSGEENNMKGWAPDGVRFRHYEALIRTGPWDESDIHSAQQILEKRRAFRDLTQYSQLPLLRQSLIVHHIWSLLSAQLMRDLVSRKAALPQQEGGLPFFESANQDLYRWLVKRWFNTHQQIAQVAKASGILDLHFLQPNPFIPNSKVLTSRENHILEYTFPIKDLVMHSRPFFVDTIAKIKERPKVIDLAQLYFHSGEEIWSDGLHPNTRGLELLVEEIMRRFELNYKAANNPN